MTEPRRRGTTTIAEKVFAKVAGQAAHEVAASGGPSGGLLGLGSRADANARPRVGVDLSTDSVDLDLAVGISYPGSIRAAAQAIREHVTMRVQNLTGVSVHRVDIDVTFLTVIGDSDHSDARLHRQRALR